MTVATTIKGRKPMHKIRTLLVGLVFAFAATGPAAASDKDIVDTASEAGVFQTLLAAATAADLVEALQADGPITIFAPTDEAFAKLPAGTVESLLLPENKDQLIDVLTFHIVSGAIGSDQVSVDAVSLETLQGENLDVVLADGSVQINGSAQVISADVAASNGVIHVIDTVLLPQG